VYKVHKVLLVLKAFKVPQAFKVLLALKALKVPKDVKALKV
jgi:hypothetical protein